MNKWAYWLEALLINIEISSRQKQPFAGVLQNRCS